MIAGYGDGSGPVSRAGSGYPIQEHPTTPGPFGGPRNEGTIPGVGAAMPLSLPGLDVLEQGDQRHSIPGLPASSAPPLPPGPHPSLLSVTGGGSSSSSQQGLYQQMQIMSLPLPPPLLSPHQHPSHLPLLPHPHLPRPVSSVPGPLPTSVPLQSSMVRGFLSPPSFSLFYSIPWSFSLSCPISSFFRFFSPSVFVYINVSFIWSIFISLSFYPWLCNAPLCLSCFSLTLTFICTTFLFFLMSLLLISLYIISIYLSIAFIFQFPFFLLPSLLTSLYLQLSLLFSLCISWILSRPLSFNLHQHLSFFMSIHCISLSFLSAPPSSFKSHSLILPLILFFLKTSSDLVLVRLSLYPLSSVSVSLSSRVAPLCQNPSSLWSHDS